MNLRLLLGWLILQQHTHSHTINWFLVMKKSLSSKLSLRLSQKCEKKNAWGRSVVLFIVACHHVAITQMVFSHVLQTIK